MAGGCDTHWFLHPGCLGCHQFRGVDGRALYLRAKDGERMGGHALRLERYAAIVWKRFIFDRFEAAQEVGESSIGFDSDVA
ncbi:MAG: hypothetical protein ABGX04_16625 [Myxococcales bacterium]|nr:hypothetical protein [Myxococcales bacterium]HIK86447.1 hypothetical protein [Myxococcales bacterium]